MHLDGTRVALGMYICDSEVYQWDTKLALGDHYGCARDADLGHWASFLGQYPAVLKCQKFNEHNKNIHVYPIFSSSELN